MMNSARYQGFGTSLSSSYILLLCLDWSQILFSRSRPESESWWELWVLQIFHIGWLGSCTTQWWWLSSVWLWLWSWFQYSLTQISSLSGCTYGHLEWVCLDSVSLYQRSFQMDWLLLSWVHWCTTSLHGFLALLRASSLLLLSKYCLDLFLRSAFSWLLQYFSILRLQGSEYHSGTCLTSTRTIGLVLPSFRILYQDQSFYSLVSIWIMSYQVLLELQDLSITYSCLHTGVQVRNQIR